MSLSANIHATCVRIGRAGVALKAPASAGVLLLGDSGAGKSDLALRLIGRGAKLVADDRTELSVERGRLIARAPKSISGLMEVRGVGIVEMPHAASAHIVLVVDLAGKVKRLPERQRFAPPKGLQLAQKARPFLIALRAFEESAPDKILAAVAALHNDALRCSVKRI
jgi:serine kinase of HPr protein (carbohydrate metabolism regulator)